jgi:hypothetical protein
MSEALLSGTAPTGGDTGPEVTPLGEGRMVGEDCWREVHRLRLSLLRLAPNVHRAKHSA